MITMDRILSEFQVEDQSTGKTFDVIEYQEYSEYRTINGDWHRADGFKRLELADGSGDLNYIDPQTFKIVATNQIVRKIG
jgi:glutamine cyclotransferase